MIIIGLLMTLATVSFNKVQLNARDNARRTAVNSIASSLEAYRVVYQSYPGIDTASDITALNGGDTNPGHCIHDNTYYYNPNSGGDCSVDRGVPAGNIHNYINYKPSPNWIPGLGKFLTPIPTEERYLGATDSDSTVDASFDAAGIPTGTTRTLSYKKLPTSDTNFYRVVSGLEAGGTYIIVKGRF